MGRLQATNQVKQSACSFKSLGYELSNKNHAKIICIC
jgi:hypothetical protein